MGLMISLILVGIILIFAEILIIPGVGVAGVLGLVSLGGSCFYAFHEFGSLTGGIVTGANALLLVVLTIYVLRAKTWKRMALETNIESKAVADESAMVSVGDTGKTVTRLAPMGSALFNGHVAEVKALEGIVEPDTMVEIVLIEDNRIYVRSLNY